MTLERILTYVGAGYVILSAVVAILTALASVLPGGAGDACHRAAVVIGKLVAALGEMRGAGKPPAAGGTGGGSATPQPPAPSSGAAYRIALVEVPAVPEMPRARPRPDRLVDGLQRLAFAALTAASLVMFGVVVVIGVHGCGGTLPPVSQIVVDAGCVASHYDELAAAEQAGLGAFTVAVGRVAVECGIARDVVVTIFGSHKQARAAGKALPAGACK